MTPQSVKDALADAETYLLNANGPCGCNYDGRGEGWTRPHFHGGGPWTTAMHLGFAASVFMRSDEQDLLMGQDPISCARYAGRAAFRAVPGLRGYR